MIEVLDVQRVFKSNLNKCKAILLPALLFVLLISSTAVIDTSAYAPAAVSGTVSLLNAKRNDPSNVAVWLEPVKKAKAQPTQNPILRQKGKQFTPRVLMVTTGSTVSFPNDDPFPHNVFSPSTVRRFDLGLYQAGDTRTLPFARPGTVPVYCNIHPQMKAFILVVDSPYFAVSGKSGDIQISNVPPGNYRLKVWHERAKDDVLNALSKQITVSGGGASLGTIQVDEAGAFSVQHKNKDGKDYAAN